MQSKEEEDCFSKTLMREVNMNHTQVSKQVFTLLSTSLAAAIRIIFFPTTELKHRKHMTVQYLAFVKKV